MINQKILGVIPARGGSKGLPQKNIRPLLGKPLVAWTIEQAQASQYLSRTIVSTDNDEIAAIAREYGGDVPFMRPAEYAQDQSPSWEAIIHALNSLEKVGERYDYVALLEPTSPLRKPTDIDNALAKLIDYPDAEAVISVGEVHTEHPSIVKKIVGEYIHPYQESDEIIWQRQQMDAAYFPYGVIYACVVDRYKQEKSFYLSRALPYYIERWQNYEIDDLYDFMIIEVILKYFLEGKQ